MKINDERVDMAIRVLKKIEENIEKKKNVQQVKAAAQEGIFYSTKQFNRIFEELTAQSFDKLVRKSVYNHCYQCVQQEGKALSQKEKYGDIPNFRQNYKYNLEAGTLGNDTQDDIKGVTLEEFVVIYESLQRLERNGFFDTCSIENGMIKIDPNWKSFLEFLLSSKNYIVPVDLIQMFGWDQIDKETKMILLVYIEQVRLHLHEPEFMIKEDVFSSAIGQAEYYNWENPVCMNGQFVYSRPMCDVYKSVFMDYIDKWFNLISVTYPDGNETPLEYRRVVAAMRLFRPYASIPAIAKEMNLEAATIREILWEMAKKGFIRLERG